MRSAADQLYAAAGRTEPERAAYEALKVQIGGDHYKDMAIQPIQYILANEVPFAEGCVVKYVTRWRKKGGLRDLKKARHMLDLLIEAEEARDLTRP